MTLQRVKTAIAGMTALAVLPAFAQREPVLKDLMPKGMVIGVAINQRQSDGVDGTGVEIITRHFNQISPRTC